ncbi:MAG: class I SAM-dependent methyltransferase [Candidatus Limnocylindrales bacterium]
MAERVGGPVLELGVGSGRLAVPLADAGFAVTGVDADPQMLARAGRRWAEATKQDGPEWPAAGGSLDLVQADLLGLDLDARFGLAFIGLNTLLLLDEPARQAAALRVLAHHLAPNGRAVVDVWLPGVDDLAIYDGRTVLQWVRDDPDTGERVAKTSSADYDRATRVVELFTLFDAWPPEGGPLRRTARTDRLRLVGADELIGFARDAGLQVEQLAGDYDLTPFGPGSERVVLVAGLV